MYRFFKDLLPCRSLVFVLLIFIFIASGFWMCQQQLYATMPKYVIRMAGEAARPGWIANVNPLVVVLMVNLITKWMSRYTALTSMVVGMILVPVAALVMSTGNLLGSEPIFGMHPITLMLVVGIMLPLQTVFQLMAGISVPIPALCTKVLIFVMLAGFALYFEHKLKKNTIYRLCIIPLM
mgnify:CR=1 FL=1